MSSFAERRAAAKEAAARGKTMSGDFEEPEVGTYIGILQSLKANVSQQGRPQVGRYVTITEGTQKGIVARDFTSLEQDFLVARMRAYVEAHDYAWPEELYDEEQCDAQETFVFHKDLHDTLLAIEADAPQYRFQYSKREGKYPDIKVLEILVAKTTEEAIGASAGGPEAEAKAEPGADDTGDDAASADDDRIRMLAFCADQGVTEVKDEDDLETAVEVIKSEDYAFWQKGVTAKQLADADLKGEDPDAGISDEDVAMLLELGLEAHVVQRTAARKGARKRG